MSDKETYINKLFKDTEETMLLKFRGWENELNSSQGEKGGLRERRVADFLRSILPNKYGIGTGHIIDSKSGISGQCDIVIYDKNNGIVFPIDEYYSLFPAECVYAVIEVKTRLGASDGEKNGPSGDIYDTIEKTTKLRSLKRLFPSRVHSLTITEPIKSVVFAYETTWSNQSPDDCAVTVRDWYELLGDKYKKWLPELIFVLNPRFILFHSGPQPYNAGNFAGFTDINPLLYFISDLLRLLEGTAVRTPDLWNEYGFFKEKNYLAKIFSSSSFDRRYLTDQI